jgi:hypothetical protein
MKNELRIWIDEDGAYNWEGEHLKPSEIAMMATILQQLAYEMMSDEEDTEKEK